MQGVVSKNFRAPRTKEAYNFYISKAREFIKHLAKEGVTPPGVPVLEPDPQLALLASSLDGPANAQSPEAVRLFMAFKCVEQGCGISTADGINAGLKAMWDQ